MKAIAAASDHAAAINNRGVLYHWGMECADEQLTQFVSTPTRVRHFNNITVTSLSCGPHHTVLVGNGRLFIGISYSWGQGSYGRLGVGHSRSLFFPECVNELYQNSRKIITQVSAGDKHTAFLTKDGEVYTCGNNAFGQLGYLTASGYSDVPRIVCLGKNATGDETRFVVCIVFWFRINWIPIVTNKVINRLLKMANDFHEILPFTRKLNSVRASSSLSSGGVRHILLFCKQNSKTSSITNIRLLLLIVIRLTFKNKKIKTQCKKFLKRCSCLNILDR